MNRRSSSNPAMRELAEQVDSTGLVWDLRTSDTVIVSVAL